MRTEIQQALLEFVLSLGFDNFSLALSYIDSLSRGENFDNWDPTSSELVEIFGGTNCVGLATLFYEFLSRMSDIELTRVATPSNRLPDGLSAVDVPFQHLAIFAREANVDNGLWYLLDPGLGLVFPIPIQEGSQEVIADKTYEIVFLEGADRLQVTKRNGVVLHFDFVRVGNEFDEEEQLQKPLFRATSEFKIDRFNEQGYKTASIKIDFIRRNIVFMIFGEIKAFSFEQLEELFDNDDYQRLSIELHDAHLSEKISRIVNSERDIVQVWFESLQRSYYLENPNFLSPFETSWEELREIGYEGGGVVVVLVNENDEVLLYEVPQSDFEGFIQRFPGQLNLFVETADPMEDGQLESFDSNLARAFREEIGIPIPDDCDLQYFETDYGPNSTHRARIAVLRVDSSIIAQVHEHSLLVPDEINNPRWTNLNDLLRLNLEPNAREILNKLINNGAL